MSDLLPVALGLLAGFVLAAAILTGRIRQLRRDLRESGPEIADMRDTVRRLERELEATRARPAEDSAAILADNAELRRRMDELADALLAQGGQKPSA